MKVSELDQLVRIAKDLGVTEVKFDNGRDGKADLVNVSGTIKETGIQVDPCKAIVLSLGP